MYFGQTTKKYIQLVWCAVVFPKKQAKAWKSGLGGLGNGLRLACNMLQFGELFVCVTGNDLFLTGHFSWVVDWMGGPPSGASVTLPTGKHVDSVLQQTVDSLKF
eukprot:TRINITY_DN67318_c6_g2_i1.p3 TRINITY_DN67318_c6_g2~~TRINITY_DN67318_c6_g2_i1.p3  ORF type:complete len:104 (+),score=1.64 TRINITY_DN67318_c6_g2_i1:236-547(+)